MSVNLCEVELERLDAFPAIGERKLGQVAGIGDAEFDMPAPAADVGVDAQRARVVAGEDFDNGVEAPGAQAFAFGRQAEINLGRLTVRTDTLMHHAFLSFRAVEWARCAATPPSRDQSMRRPLAKVDISCGCPCLPHESCLTRLRYRRSVNCSVMSAVERA